MLLLTIKANKDKVVKINHFENDQECILHGTPVYSDEIHPNNFKDSFLLNGSSWIEFPSDNIFNLYQKEFTITWWEYLLGDIDNRETGSINFVTSATPPNHYYSYLLLHYKSGVNSYCYGHNVANATGWNIFTELTTGRPPNELNTWNNFAFTSKYIDGIHTFNTYKNGIKIATKTSSLTFPNIGNIGKLVIGTYGDYYVGCNRYLQNIRFYDEPLFDNDYNIYKFENYEDNSIILNNLKQNSDLN